MDLLFVDRLCVTSVSRLATSFGPLDGKIIRIGNMGYSSQKRNILFTLGAIEAVLIDNGVKVPAGEAVAAALQVYKNA